MPTRTEIIAGLKLPAYPRTASYDTEWVLENRMGPHPLWLMEALTDQMQLEPGMRVLDLGCGRALTSVFLAREFDVQVWAADLWVDPSENWPRIHAAGVGSSVFPLKMEAHAMPFATGFFDAIVSVDAFHYFGTSDLYLEEVIEFLVPDGQIGIVAPGLTRELDEVPKEISSEWYSDYWSFHSPDWWARHWNRSGVVDGVAADLVPNGARDWLTWIEACTSIGIPAPDGEFVDTGADLLRLDEGRTIAFSRITARRKSEDLETDGERGVLLSHDDGATQQASP